MIGILVPADVDATLQQIAETERLLSTCTEQLGLWQEQRQQARLEYCEFDPWSKRQLAEARCWVRYYRARIDSLETELELLEPQLECDVLLLLG